VVDEVVNAMYNRVPVTDEQSIVEPPSEGQPLPANEGNPVVESDAEPAQRTFAGRYTDRARREPDRFMHPKCHFRGGKVVYDHLSTSSKPPTSGNLPMSRNSYGSSQGRNREAATRGDSPEGLLAFNGCMIGCASTHVG
jgi:hypothetical protein